MSISIMASTLEISFKNKYSRSTHHSFVEPLTPYYHSLYRESLCVSERVLHAETFSRLGYIDIRPELRYNTATKPPKAAAQADIEAVRKSHHAAASAAALDSSI